MKKKEEMMQDFILERSESIFIRKGYRNTSMDHVARACEISKPTLYRYFDSKYELFMALYMRYQDWQFGRIREAAAQDKDRKQLLAELIGLTLNLAEEKKDFLKMVLREFHQIIHQNIDRHFKSHLRSHNEMIDWLADFLDGIIHPDIKARCGSRMVAHTIFNMIQGVIMDIIMEDDIDLAQQRDFIVHFVRRGALS